MKMNFVDENLIDQFFMRIKPFKIATVAYLKSDRFAKVNF